MRRNCDGEVLSSRTQLITQNSGLQALSSKKSVKNQCVINSAQLLTIVQGFEDLKKMDEHTVNNSGIRNKGGGRKSILSTESGIDAAFLEVLKFQTAGDPMNELIKWTNLTHKEIALGLKEAGFIVSLPIVSKLLKSIKM